MSEFSRIFDAARLPAGPQRISASAEECAALAKRFGLVSVGSLTAEVTLTAEGRTVRAAGRLCADVVQSCAISGEDLPARIDEPLALRFVPELSAPDPDEEVELEAGEMDEIEMEHNRFDLGEALAQSLALGIDPYAVGPDAEAARRKAGLTGEGQAGPLAEALKGLLKK